MKTKLQIVASALYFLIVLPLYTEVAALITLDNTLANITGFALLFGLGFGTLAAGRFLYSQLKSRLKI